jgi:fructokinase
VRIGIDLGGTKIEIVALARDGSQLMRRRVSTPPDDYEATLDAIAQLVSDAEAELGRRGSVGIASPGSVVPATGTLRNSNSTVLNGKSLASDLAKRLGREIRIANDANCLALSEAIDGAGLGAHVVFAAILGTGVGAGIAIDSRVFAGRNGIAGEWGHNPLPWMRSQEQPGAPCYCGKRGCVETFLSGPSLAKGFALATGRALTPREIAAEAQNGESQASLYMDLYEDRLARGLAAVINIIDPDVIILGGGVSNISRLYENVPRLIERYVFAMPADVKLLPALHGDSSGVRGAAWLS